MLEIMVVLAIMAVLAGIAMPSYKSMIEDNQLISDTEKTRGFLTYARSESVRNNSDISLNFDTGSSWCIGLSDSGVCDCNSADSCTIAGVEKILESNIDSDISLSLGGNISGTNFDPQRGTLEKTGVPTTGSVSFTKDSRSTTISLNILGRTDTCSDTIKHYESC